MMKNMWNIGVLFLAAFSVLGASEKLYINIDEMQTGEDSFHIHIGGNEWIQTSSVESDANGFYTYTSNISLMSTSHAYERKWKCPYCNLYWPIGTPCQNADCPSKYKN